MELMTMAEAARRMGVSVDTVRRRLRRGELRGRHSPTPQGFIWLVELPERSGPCLATEAGAAGFSTNPADADAGTLSAPAASGNGSAPAGDLRALRELVDVLRHEVLSRDRQLESKDRQIEQLHLLLRQAQAAPASPGPPRAWDPVHHPTGG